MEKEEESKRAEEKVRRESVEHQRLCICTVVWVGLIETMIIERKQKKGQRFYARKERRERRE